MIEQVEIAVGGRAIVGDYFTANGRNERIAILLHGFLASKEDMHALSQSLLSEGIDSLAIDLNGHGASEGAFAEFTISRAIDDVKAAVGFARSKGYSKIGLFGFSLGGFVALAALSKDPSLAGTAVLGAPVSDFEGTFSKADLNEWKSGNMFNSKHLGVSIGLNYQFYTDGLQYKDFSGVSLPVLIIHGTEDDVVPIAQSEALAKRLKSAHLLRLDGATHNIFSNGYGPTVLGTVAGWLKTRL
ncbi:MAG: S9 family peptidase [Candidatus Micrarchaeota archaeon]|nr:S9 family peptidase [Candidatus Micrarchaeota archaeon]